jgi:predicted PurR-regulated permease PerM
MTTFLICYIVFLCITFLLVLADIVYYDIKDVIKNYENIDKQLEYFSKEIENMQLSEKTYQQLADAYTQYSYWNHLKQTKEKLKWLFHISKKQ